MGGLDGFIQKLCLEPVLMADHTCGKKIASILTRATAGKSRNSLSPGIGYQFWSSSDFKTHPNDQSVHVGISANWIPPLWSRLIFYSNIRTKAIGTVIKHETHDSNTNNLAGNHWLFSDTHSIKAIEFFTRQ